MVEVLRPTTFAEAAGLLTGTDGAMPLAGGTDIMLDMRNGRVAPTALVDLSGITDDRDIVFEDGWIRCSALTTIRTLERDPRLAERAPAVVEAARVLGSVQIREMATVGGNLCHATPSAEMPPALAVHHAEVDVVGPGGDRTEPLADLFAGPGSTTLHRGDLLASLRFRDADDLGSCYLRQTVRWSMDLAGVGVAASVEVDGPTIVAATIALGAVAPTPVIVEGGGTPLVGSAWSDDAAGEAGRIASAASAPITDARGSADYRRSVVAALVPRALRIAYLRASGSWPEGRLSPTNGLITEEWA